MSVDHDSSQGRAQSLIAEALTGMPPNLLIVSSCESLEAYPKRTLVSVNSPPSEESESYEVIVAKSCAVRKNSMREADIDGGVKNFLDKH